MKIEHPSVGVVPAGGESAVARPVPRPAAEGGDGVHLSTGIHLAERALAAADLNSDRSQAIAQAQEALRSGAVGTDLEQLADRIIDTLLHSDGDAV